MKKIILFGIVFIFFILASGLVSAGCCLNANNGGANTSCIQSDDMPVGCEPGMWIADDCSDRSECEKGCCIFDSECHAGYTEAQCYSNSGSSFDSDEDCSTTPSCGDVCCLVEAGGTSAYDFIPSSQCDEIGNEVEEDIDNSLDCDDLNDDPSFIRGCCLVDDSICRYTDEDSCSDDGGRFEPVHYCRFLGDQCDPVCITHSSKGPGQFEDTQNNIYWLDSCGNQEELFVECDPLSEKPVQIGEGNWECGAATCDGNDLWDNLYTDENHDGDLINDNGNFYGRGYRFNGESWCEYQQARVGPGLDLPGTRHYKHYCDTGVERVEVQGKGREFICVEEPITFGSHVMSNASFVSMNVDGCLGCNRGDQTTLEKAGCCNSQNALGNYCSFIQRKRTGAGDSLTIYVNETKYNQLEGVMDGEIERSGPNVHLSYIHLKYYRGSNLVYTTGDILDRNVLELGDCEAGVCNISLFDVPPGEEEEEFRLEVEGRGCVTIGACPLCHRECDTEIINLGSHPLVSPGTVGGVCVSLVPPEGDSNCDAYYEINYLLDDNGGISGSLQHNFYFDFPFNVLRFNEDYDYGPSRGSLIAEDMNLLCSSLGDCGISPNLAGEITLGGYSTSEACTTVGSTSCVLPMDNLLDMEEEGFRDRTEGEPVRPEAYLAFFFLPLGGLFRKLRKKVLVSIALISLVVLFGCAGGDTVGAPGAPPDLVVNCSSWVPPATTDNCGKCHTLQSQGGLLPDIDLVDSDGNPFYFCNQELCESLGNCQYVENLDEIVCEENFVDENTIPKISFTAMDYNCNSVENSQGCSEEADINSLVVNNEVFAENGAILQIPGLLEAYNPIRIDFRTLTSQTDPQEQPMVTTCRYGINDASTPDDFESQFESPGQQRTEHILYLTNLPPSVSGSYNVFIKCSSVYDPTKEDLAEVKFNIGESYDNSAPRIDSISPMRGHSYAKYNETIKEVNLLVSGSISLCRWDNESLEYSELGRTEEMIGEDVEAIQTNEFVCQGYSQGVSNCSAELNNISLGINRFWFACMGTNGIASSTWPDDSEGYIVEGTEQLNITNIRCDHSLGSDCGTIYDREFNFSIDSVGGVNNDARCWWGIDEFNLQNFAVPGGSIFEPELASHHEHLNYEHETGDITIRFRCEDLAGNVAEENVSLTLEADSRKPRIIKVYRSGALLYIETNELSTCSYVSTLVGSFVNSTDFSTDNYLEHSTNINDNNLFRVRCEDRFGNQRERKIYMSDL